MLFRSVSQSRYISENHPKFEKFFEKDRLTELQANKVADALFADIASGVAKRYTDGFEQHQANLEEVKCVFFVMTADIPTIHFEGIVTRW